MKFKRIISFALISVFSIGTLVGVAEINEKPVDRKFVIKDITGMRDSLNSVAIENVIKVDTNAFEKVVITKDKVSFSDTKYDLFHGVGEKVLNNKELYRGNSHPQEYENENLLMTVSFNQLFPYSSDEPFVNIAVKDKKTKKVTKEKIKLLNIGLNEQIVRESLMTFNDKVLYCFLTNNLNGNTQKTTMHVYEISTKPLQMKKLITKDVSLTGGYTDATTPVIDGERILSVLNSDKETKLLTVDPVKKVLKQMPLDVFSEDTSYIDSMFVDNENIFINTDSIIYVLDKNTLKTRNSKGLKPSYADKYEYIWVVEQKIIDNKLYVIYDAGKNNGKSDSYINVYNYENGSTLYEGKLPTMADRGVDKAYTFSDQ